ncbi:MAG TPA: hypothetical protein VFY14_00715 [Streptomyces sp.]|nr:hypothetical protein [Streptomyces sp.]
MNLKRTIAVSLSTAALVIGGAGLAQANDSRVVNNTQILSCLNLELINIPILAADNNTFDCSTNIEKKHSYESRHSGH